MARLPARPWRPRKGSEGVAHLCLPPILLLSWELWSAAQPWVQGPSSGPPLGSESQKAPGPYTMEGLGRPFLGSLMPLETPAAHLPLAPGPVETPCVLSRPSIHQPRAPAKMSPEPGESGPAPRDRNSDSRQEKRPLLLLLRPGQVLAGFPRNPAARPCGRWGLSPAHSVVLPHPVTPLT